MSLKLLLDENMSQIVAVQLKVYDPDFPIESVHTWRDGLYEGHSDRSLLAAAREDSFTLVTYDQKTIPSLLSEMYAEGESHAGVIFVDDQSISGNDFGVLIRALILLWERYGDQNWQDRVAFLEKPKG